ncbi:MAG: UvrD-helicase domain-containing protein [Myxococcales bacterium]|nr:UvrD-helicase domain-containing protein [Myxococcales bacterium]MDD9968908.1 UvrD-helicase domain-containing protein [Myxococcales bacterium]
MASSVKLNPSQQAAVDHRGGPLLILAGAGSGKTRVLTHRIAKLVEEGVAPQSILAVSFTNKAAEEMRDRMLPLIGGTRARKLLMSTFHSFGVRFLHEEHEALGFGKRFVIFDQGDSLGVIKDILRELRESGAARRLDPAAIMARISNWKGALLAPEQVPESDFEYDDVARDVYPEYVARMRVMRAVDFDDLVALPVRILQDDPNIRHRWQARLAHVLIDEFQDTSRVQLELVKQLEGPYRNVCVVGDDDQSIYAFRGAEVGNILDFDRHFPGTRIVKLEDNYRSRTAIIEVANAAIAQSKNRHGKVLRAVRGPGDAVRLCACVDPAAEAKFVVAEINELCPGTFAHDEVAVLYRSNLQARLIEEELRASGVPYRLFGGTQFFDRKEVKDAAAYLRLLVNPRDEISLRRIINYPARGVGAKSVERLSAFAQAREISLYRAMGQALSADGIPDNGRRALVQLHGQLEDARKGLEAGTSLTAVARKLLAAVDIQGDLSAAADGGKLGAIRWGNVEHLLGWLERYEREHRGETRSIQRFLERVALRGDPEQEASGPGVVLSTLHASKGLEFRCVFLIGCVEGQLPHSRTTDPKVTEATLADVDEERRLFYVGVTRACDRLYVTRPEQKMLRGKRTQLAPSRFLEGLPEAHLEEVSPEAAGSLEFDELAALGRQFLQQLSADKGPPRPT